MYNPSSIEKKWQKYWKENKTFYAHNESDKEKYYILVEFPYPSGSGLHVGHCKSYTALDSLARMKRMQGYNVLFPMGWDAFGAPAEQYAIANKIHPKEAVKENIDTFKSQIESIGISFDWSREFATTDPEYYKWTQWQFLKFFEHNMAYKAKKDVNWCPRCKTVLSNEDSSGGVCERCGENVVQKEKEQWMLRMSDYAEDLLDGLKDTKFAEKIKLGQINWIGRSTGIELSYQIAGIDDVVTVFTTLPDTNFGATFLVIAPEHPLIEKYKDKIENYDQVQEYVQKCKNKTEFERKEMNKDKTGVRIEGVDILHPLLNNKKIPVFISDYVLMGYGTGAVVGVPAHDERDYDFAVKFDIPIVPVIKMNNGTDNETLPTQEHFNPGEGTYINSEFLNGMTNQQEAIDKISDYFIEKGVAKRVVNYRLQDWIFSRQRFWGEPIPLVHCEDCGWVAVPEKDLPVRLPDIAEYEPTEDGESPLANITDWVNTPCPKCGKMGKRETDTMPNWAGSSWYWLRYMDPNNTNEFASQEALKYWGKVDWYNGGMEHTARHLLYARFWNQFLYNIGLVPNKEPFETRVSHGMILGENGVKMSKSLGNVINPDDVVNELGADTLRIYEMFIGDYEKDASWSDNGLKGCKRFLDRLWRLQEKLSDKEGYTNEIVVNKTIKKVSYDIINMKYNTAISALMIMFNEYEKQESVSRDDLRVFITLLNPIAPHITEEINELNKLGGPIALCPWPIYDEAKTIDDVVEIAVQVNGKLRGTIEIAVDSDEDDVKNQALELDNVKAILDGKEPKKVIVIKNKIVNIVA